MNFELKDFDFKFYLTMAGDTKIHSKQKMIILNF